MSYFDINLTALFDGTDPYDVSPLPGSARAAEITWANAIECAETGAIDGIPADEMVDHLVEYGAWIRDELEAMPAVELRAMVAQEIAADIMAVQSGEPDLGTLESDFLATHEDDLPYHLMHVWHDEESGALMGQIYLGM